MPETMTFSEQESAHSPDIRYYSDRRLTIENFDQWWRAHEALAAETRRRISRQIEENKRWLKSP